MGQRVHIDSLARARSDKGHTPSRFPLGLREPRAQCADYRTGARIGQIPEGEAYRPSDLSTADHLRRKIGLPAPYKRLESSAEPWVLEPLRAVYPGSQLSQVSGLSSQLRRVAGPVVSRRRSAETPGSKPDRRHVTRDGAVLDFAHPCGYRIRHEDEKITSAISMGIPQSRS